MADLADHSPDTSSTATVDPDAELAALIEKRTTAWSLTCDAYDDDIDAAYDELDRIDALITAAPARTLTDIHLKAGICRAIMDADGYPAWPMVASVLIDLQRVPLDDMMLLRSIFAELAAVKAPPVTPHLADLTGACEN